jgi:hypothetical protein
MVVKRREYMLKNDEDIGRLTIQHPVLKDTIGGNLVLPYIDVSFPGSRILDSGTADGTSTSSCPLNSIGAAVIKPPCPKSSLRIIFLEDY